MTGTSRRDHLSLFKALILSFAALLSLCASRVSAQTELTAGLRGSVKTTASGEKVAGARVLVTSERLRVKREAQTNEDGEFTVFGLPPAEDYVVSAFADGFSEAARSDVSLVSGEAATIELSLELKSLSATVIITDEASPVVNNAPEVSQVVDARRATELPSNGRSVNRFALLNPHVRNTGGLGADGSTSARLSINANSYRQTFFKLDGNSNYDFVFANAPQQQISLSSVQEFKVLTNQYSAEYGGSSAGIVSTVTKSGTHEFNGEAFFFLRPSGIQSRPPVSSLRVPNRLTQFGGALGGPVWNERTTFFLSYEQTRANRGAFVQSPQPLTYVGQFRDYLGLLRFDYALNNTHAMSLRLNANRNLNDNQNDRVSGLVQPSAASVSKSQGVGFQFTDRTVWNSSIVNELRASYVNSLPSASSALFPQVSVIRPTYSTEGGSSYSWVRTETWQVADQLAFQFRHHDIKVGGDIARQVVRDFSSTPFGEYRFNPGTPAQQPNPIEYTQRFGEGFVRYGQTLLSAFAQDNWRVTPRLTANLGLRYDNQSSTDDRNNFAPRLGFAYDLAGDSKTIIRGGAGVFYDQYYMYITRRFLLEGIDAKIRTYRFTYDAGGNPTTTGAPVFPNSLTTLPNGTTEAIRDYVYLPAERLLNPYNVQFSLGLQRQLFNDWTLTFDAIHSRTLKQQRVNDINAPAPFIRTAQGQTRSVAAADATRPFGTTYQNVRVRKVAIIENTASSNYDALDFGLLKRFANRYQLEAHYVYSSALNYSMFFGEPDTGIPNQFRVPDNLERGPSDFHQRHRFVSHGLVELPYQSQLSFVATLGSGLPINAVTGVDNDGDGYRFDRPVGFARNSFRTPMQATFDASLAKRFEVREGLRVELRAEVFNLFNRNNYIKLQNIYGNSDTPRADFLTPLAGVQNSDPARQFQFGARLLF
jgi:outer membrane receptor protein involved in Fe transport